MKRYRLKKDLPTFKAGEVFVLWNSIEEQGLLRESDDIMAYHQKTLDKFPNILEEWFEEIKPAEPLIKDEKIRKAVRAWAEANDIEAGLYDADTFSIGCDDNFISFNNGFADETKIYTIAELCGEEEE